MIFKKLHKIGDLLFKVEKKLECSQSCQSMQYDVGPQVTRWAGGYKRNIHKNEYPENE